MKPDVQETIRDISSEIARLQDLINALSKLDGPHLPALPVRQIPAHAQPVAVKTSPDRKTAPSRPPRDTDAGRAALSTARGLVEPFTAPNLASALGCTIKNAGNFINRWNAKGWVVRMGVGEYMRSPKFPADASAKSNAILDEIHRDIASKQPAKD